MNKTTATKLVARIVVGAGTSTISKSIIDNNVVPGNLFQKISVAAASVVIGSMASEAAKTHTDTQIDNAIALWNSSVKSTDTASA